MQHINSTFKFDEIIDEAPFFLNFFFVLLSQQKNFSLIFTKDIIIPRLKIKLFLTNFFDLRNDNSLINIILKKII